jgi:hypothetical protein
VRTSSMLLAAVCVILVGARPSLGATVLATPPLGVDAAHTFSCLATNLDKKPIDVTIERVDVHGDVTGTSHSLSVQPGAIAGGGFSGIGGFFYCRMTGFSPKKVRLTACVSADGVECSASATGF